MEFFVKRGGGASANPKFPLTEKIILFGLEPRDKNWAQNYLLTTANKFINDKFINNKFINNKFMNVKFINKKLINNKSMKNKIKRILKQQKLKKNHIQQKF